MPNAECFCCNASVEKHLAVICSICKNSYKYSCVALSQSEVRSINVKSKNISWNCVTCNTLGNDIASLKAVILGLQSELRELKANNLKNLSSSVNYEDVIQEVEERQKRRTNIIIFGIAEQSSDLDKNARLSEERLQVAGIINGISPGTVLAENANIFRLGKFNATSQKPRPIRLRFDNEHMVQDIIRKFVRARKDNNRFKHISISSDRTPKQLEHLKATKMELEERKNAGEQNIKIQFVRGSPKIVSLN